MQLAESTKKTDNVSLLQRMQQATCFSDLGKSAGKKRFQALSAFRSMIALKRLKVACDLESYFSMCLRDTFEGHGKCFVLAH
eukprot:2467585-Amphidinium_carterae.1